MIKRELISELLEASRRRNGTKLLSEADAERIAVLINSAEHKTFESLHGQHCKVNDLLCVSYGGHLWSVAAGPFMVGDLVFCVPARRDDALRVRAHRESTSGIWAAPAGPARNPQRSAQPGGSVPNSGSQTTSHRPQGSDHSPDPAAHSPNPSPSSASPQGRKRNRRKGKAHAASAQPPAAIRVVLHVTFELLHDKQGNGKGLRS